MRGSRSAAPMMKIKQEGCSMRRRLVIMLVCAVSAFGAFAVSSTSTALAGKPTPCPIGTCINGPVSYPAGMVCPFAVRVAPVSGSNLEHTLANGDLLFTGHLIQTATNLQTGESVIFPASGPLRLIFNADGTLTFVSFGPILWTFFSQDVGGPGLFLFKGRVVIQSSPDGFATSVSHVPNTTDVCQELS